MKHPEFLKPNSVFIIAEAGVNHNGDVKLAKQLVDVAAAAQVDAIKFQTFVPGECTGKFAYKVAYQDRAGISEESRFEMSRQLALSFDDFRIVQEYCKQKGVLFCSTPDGVESLRFLVRKMCVPFIKISSTEVTHLAFLDEVARQRLPIILSTGMSTFNEVNDAVAVIRKQSDQSLIILHCTTEYPAPLSEVNLRAMVTLRDAFGVPVGYSDHTRGFEASIAAVALGAQVIEKHVTLDRGLSGPDHQASLDPDELKRFVVAVRNTTVMLGDGIKRPSESEVKNMPGVRRGVVAAYSLKKGTVLTRDMLTYKRPDTGIHPCEIDQVIGKRLQKDLEEDEVLQWEFLQ